MSDELAEIRLDAKAYGRIVEILIDGLFECRREGSDQVRAAADRALHDAQSLMRERTNDDPD